MWLQDPRIFPSPDKLDRQHQDCNMQICYLTTPANTFHVLRRQMNRQFRKRKFSLYCTTYEKLTYLCSSYPVLLQEPSPPPACSLVHRGLYW